MDLQLGGRRTSAFPLGGSLNPSRTGCLGRCLWYPGSADLSRDARLAQPLGQSVDVGLIAKREPADVLGK